MSHDDYLYTPRARFDNNPEPCPDCGTNMIESMVFAYFADREWWKL